MAPPAYTSLSPAYTRAAGDARGRGVRAMPERNKDVSDAQIQFLLGAACGSAFAFVLILHRVIRCAEALDADLASVTKNVTSGFRSLAGYDGLIVSYLRAKNGQRAEHSMCPACDVRMVNADVPFIMPGSQN